MPSATDKVIKYLQQSRLAQIAITEMFTAHIALTPAGDYRKVLEAHVRTARRQGKEIDARLSELAERRRTIRLAREATGLITSETATVARFPWHLLRSALGLLRRTAEVEQLLDQARDEYTLSARALATYRILEHIAAAAEDAETAQLATNLRTEQESLVERLLQAIDNLAEALAEAEIHGAPAYRWQTTAAAQAVQAGAQRLREEARRIPGVAQVEGEARGAVAGAEQLPIADYDQLTAAQIIERLAPLSQDQLAMIDGYERRHAGRVTVLDKIKTLRGSDTTRR